jgi:hypothetical protein
MSRVWYNGVVVGSGSQEDETQDELAVCFGSVFLLPSSFCKHVTRLTSHAERQTRACPSDLRHDFFTFII